MKDSQSRREVRPEPAALGQYLRAKRQELGLSLRQLAPRVGIHASYLGNIETGRYRHPSPETLQRLARVLGVKYADLFAATGYLIPEELPRLELYLQARYGVSEKDARVLRKHLEKVRTISHDEVQPSSNAK